MKEAEEAAAEEESAAEEAADEGSAAEEAVESAAAEEPATEEEPAEDKEDNGEHVIPAVDTDERVQDRGRRTYGDNGKAGPGDRHYRL